MEDWEFGQALQFARSIRTRELRIGPTIQVGPATAPISDAGEGSHLSSQSKDPDSPMGESRGDGPVVDQSSHSVTSRIQPSNQRTASLSEEQRRELLHWLEKMGPFRKGPFQFYGEQVASHWNSDAKWQHCLPFLKADSRVLEGDVLDLGCNNGYYMLRLLELKRSGGIYGLDPAAPFYRQFRFLQEMLDPDHPVANIRFIQAGHEALKSGGLASSDAQSSGSGSGRSASNTREFGMRRTPADGPGASSGNLQDTGISGIGAAGPGPSSDNAQDAGSGPSSDNLQDAGTSGTFSGDAITPQSASNRQELGIRRTAGDGPGASSGNAQDTGISGTAAVSRTSSTRDPDFPEGFDSILCWGVIYHRTDPIELLRTMHGALKTGGTLYLESMGIPEDPNCSYPRAIVPSGKYAGARGIWHVPDAQTLNNYLHRSGFRDIQVLKQWDYSSELNAETGLPVLTEFLDPERPGFLKDGLPAPIRILVRALR